MKVAFGGASRIQVRLGAWDDHSGLGVWIYTRKNDDIYVGKIKDGSVIFYPVGKAYAIITAEPTFFIAHDMAQEFKIAMMAALHEWGVEVQSESKIAGKLEATEKHLEDMRALVFATKPK